MSSIQSSSRQQVESLEQTIDPTSPLLKLANNLNFMQVNLQRSKAATLNAIQAMTQLQADVGLLQEPYTLNGYIPGIPTLFKVFLSANCLAAIIYKGPLTPVHKKTTDHTVTVLLESAATSLEITSIYFPPRAYMATSLAELETGLTTQPTHRIIGGDFNATSPQWGAHLETPQARIVQEFVMSYNLTILNDPESKPTFCTTRAQGWPNLTIASANTAALIQNWEVSDLPSVSDHRIITFQLGTSYTYFIKRRYKTCHGGHEAFRIQLQPHIASLEANLDNCQSPEQLDYHYNQLVQHLTKACDNTFRKKAIFATKSLSWWTPTLNAERSKIQALCSRKHKQQQSSHLEVNACWNFAKARAQYNYMQVQHYGSKTLFLDALLFHSDENLYCSAENSLRQSISINNADSLTPTFC
ncbi:uncharacterized protein LOC118202518 [Stegodyphus dumicola]|uniref:uncharacterized protein LOC118202518 n=1 Tax=Stegodyphus dumicola TaxID=202533 RepID=UPI0015A85221|nr:uncharacterized protein LOC118202518 [Stegodyphus dumicola]